MDAVFDTFSTRLFSLSEPQSINKKLKFSRHRQCLSTEHKNELTVRSLWDRTLRDGLVPATKQTTLCARTESDNA